MTDEEHQILQWHLRTAQNADHKAMGQRYRVCPEPIPGVDGLEFATKVEARLWLASNRRNLVHLVETASARGRHFETWALAEALWAYFTSNGNYDDAERCYRLAAQAAVKDRNEVARLRMMLLLAQTLNDARSFDTAADVLAEIRELADAHLDDPDPQVADQMLALAGTGLEFTGRLALKRERHDEAFTWFAKALDNAREQDRRAPNPRVVALQLWFLAKCHRALGRPDEAAEHFDRAADLLRAAGDSRTGVEVHIEASLFALERGEPDATEQVLAALDNAQDEELPQPAAAGWLDLARLSPPPRRTEYLQRALELYESIRDPAVDEVRALVEESKRKGS
ncbi:tetratricopeptide repeat protein [Glycomyces sp. NPDC046736]|uniref:tetratricopeptide repeat protein n=1 Tax=Glycomyces sp. NPDC046736 TaxID=3155615 RepID=UPI0033D0EF00